MAAKQYLDEHGLGVYDENIKDYIDTKTTGIVQETMSTTAPSTAVAGDFWTKIITTE
jgi:hypothetical protein